MLLKLKNFVRVNMESTMWYDQEVEEQIIREYGKRKLSLSSLED